MNVTQAGMTEILLFLQIFTMFVQGCLGRLQMAMPHTTKMDLNRVQFYRSVVCFKRRPGCKELVHRSSLFWQEISGKKDSMYCLTSKCWCSLFVINLVGVEKLSQASVFKHGNRRKKSKSLGWKRHRCWRCAGSSWKKLKLVWLWAGIWKPFCLISHPSHFSLFYLWR